MTRFLTLFCLAWELVVGLTCTCQANPLELVQKIPLPGIEGRIDHLALDAPADRLYVAAVGNDTVELIDLRTQKVAHELAGLHEPQGVAVVPETHELVVTNGGDGSVRFYDAGSMQPTRTLELPSDADNIRYDATARLLYVGFGNGGIAVIDPRTATTVSTMPLSGHPEAFALESRGARLFVNVPTANHIAVLDRSAGSVLSTWNTRRGFEDFFKTHARASANFPMAIDEDSRRLFVGYRRPPCLLVFDIETRTPIAQVTISGDADDILYDSVSKRLYVACGEGFIDVVEPVAGSYKRVARVATAVGARTALFDSIGRRLYVAVPGHGADKPAVFVYAAEQYF